jgi:hypothetical protein
LHLLSHRFNCGTTYSHHDVKIEWPEKRITLSFLPTHDPEAVCPAVYMPYGPEFEMQPLAAGSYAVYARALAPCMVGPGVVCQMEAVPEFAGTLTVGRGGWFLQPEQVSAKTPFTLHLLNQAYGNCHTSFSHENLQSHGGALYASFVVRQNFDHECITDIRPHGPSFEVKGLAAGKYPVYAMPQPACRYGDPPCFVPASPHRLVLVDTLEVVHDGDPTAVSPGRHAPGTGITFPPGTIQGYRPDGRKEAGKPGR